VDLDRVRQAPGPLSTAGIGDAISNLSAVADWELSAADTGEAVDGLGSGHGRAPLRTRCCTSRPEQHR